MGWRCMDLLQTSCRVSTRRLLVVLQAPTEEGHARAPPRIPMKRSEELVSNNFLLGLWYMSKHSGRRPPKCARMKLWKLRITSQFGFLGGGLDCASFKAVTKMHLSNVHSAG